MSGKNIITKIIFLFALVLTFFIKTTTSNAQSGCDRIVDNTSIQAGIDALSNGQTLCVKNGTYSESIRVNKENITVKNYSGHTPILDGGYHRGLVTSGNGIRGKVPQPDNFLLGGEGGMVSLVANGVTIDGFIIQNVAGEVWS